MRRPYEPPRMTAQAVEMEESCLAGSEVIHGERTFESAISTTESPFEAFEANDFSSETSWD